MRPIKSQIHSLITDRHKLNKPYHLIQAYYKTYEKRLDRILFLDNLSEDLINGARMSQIWLDYLILPTKIY